MVSNTTCKHFSAVMGAFGRLVIGIGWHWVFKLLEVILWSQVVRGVTIQVWPKIFVLPIDMVGISKMQKCGLKYDMCSHCRVFLFEF